MSACSALERFFLSLDAASRDPWIGVLSLMDEPLFVCAIVKGYAAPEVHGACVAKGGAHVEVGRFGRGADVRAVRSPVARGVAYWAEAHAPVVLQ